MHDVISGTYLELSPRAVQHQVMHRRREGPLLLKGAGSRASEHIIACNQTWG
jgi:hypothetical protein